MRHTGVEKNVPLDGTDGVCNSRGLESAVRRDKEAGSGDIAAHALLS
jgi:hypothetical protein